MSAGVLGPRALIRTFFVIVGGEENGEAWAVEAMHKAAENAAPLARSALMPESEAYLELTTDEFASMFFADEIAAVENLSLVSAASACEALQVRDYGTGLAAVDLAFELAFEGLVLWAIEKPEEASKILTALGASAAALRKAWSGRDREASLEVVGRVLAAALLSPKPRAQQPQEEGGGEAADVPEAPALRPPPLATWIRERAQRAMFQNKRVMPPTRPALPPLEAVGSQGSVPGTPSPRRVRRIVAGAEPGSGVRGRSNSFMSTPERPQTPAWVPERQPRLDDHETTGKDGPAEVGGASLPSQVSEPSPPPPQKFARTEAQRVGSSAASRGPSVSPTHECTPTQHNASQPAQLPTSVPAEPAASAAEPVAAGEPKPGEEPQASAGPALAPVTPSNDAAFIDVDASDDDDVIHVDGEPFVTADGARVLMQTAPWQLPQQHVAQMRRPLPSAGPAAGRDPSTLLTEFELTHHYTLPELRRYAEAQAAAGAMTPAQARAVRMGARSRAAAIVRLSWLEIVPVT